MIVVPRMSDRIPVKIGEMRLLISPLSVEHKLKLSSMTKMVGGEEIADAIRIAIYTIKYALKGLEGLSNIDGSPYQLSFEESGCLTEDSLSEVMGIMGNDKIAAACIAIGNGNLSMKLEGVEIEYKKPEGESKKK